MEVRNMYQVNRLHASTAPPCRQRGIALVAVLVLTVVAATIGITAITSARTTQTVAHNDLMGKQALIVADTGINDVLARIKSKYASASGWKFNDELASEGTAGAVAGVGALVDLDGAGIDYRFAQFGGPAPDDGYYVRVIDNFDDVSHDPASDKDGLIEIVSIGRIGTAERQVRMRIQAPPPSWGIYGKVKVTLSGGSMTDSFNSSAGPYDPLTANSGGNVGSNGDIVISGSKTVINGDASASGTVNDPSAVSGTVTNGADPVNLPSVMPCSPFSDGSGIISGSYNASKGELKTAPSIVLAPGTYCFSKLTISGGNTLTVTGPTTIYLTDKGTISGGGVMNTTGSAKNLQIFSSGADMAISGSSGAFMQVYAPDAKIHISGGSQYTGSIVGREVTMSGGTQFHYDEALGGGSALTVMGWREVVQ